MPSSAKLRAVTEQEVQEVIAEYDLGELEWVDLQGGGTGNTNLRLRLGGTDYLLRRRDPKYTEPDQLRFDSSLKTFLASRGVPVVPALACRGGDPWVCTHGRVYELFPVVQGDAFSGRADELVNAVGSIARLHEVASGFGVRDLKRWDRYDSLAELQPALDAVRSLPAAGEFAELLDEIEGELATLGRDLPDDQYWDLPLTVVHGDFHPANFLFRDAEVVGIFDLDWSTWQPRLKDAADGIIFWAGERAQPLASHSIELLTQPFSFNPGRTERFLREYQRRQPLSQREIDLIPSFIRGRWLEVRLIAQFKLPEDDRLRYLAEGTMQPLRDLRTQRFSI